MVYVHIEAVQFSEAVHTEVVAMHTEAVEARIGVVQVHPEAV